MSKRGSVMVTEFDDIDKFANEISRGKAMFSSEISE